MPNRFKINPLAMAMLLVAQGSTQYVLAQDNNDVAIASEEIVEVTGFRRNILKSQEIKRNSKNIVDAIVAEDIGKSTDQNIADALSRITGVSVQSADGEGTKITVRGANPNQNLVTLNGVPLGASDFNQGVDLSAFSADILSKIEVVKTPSADHDEGSLGATINLSTAKPLDQSKNIRNLTLQGRYSDFSEEVDYKVSGVVSQKLFDDRLGVLVTVTDEQDSLRKDQINNDRYAPVYAREARDLDGRIIGDVWALAPTQVQYQLFQNVRKRQSVDTTIQFLPTDTTELALQLTYSKQEVNESQDAIQVRPRNSGDRQNFVEGVQHDINAFSDQNTGTEFNFVPTFSDPQTDWWTIDTENRTFVKQLNRFGDGNIIHAEGGNETENKVVNLTIDQALFDNTVNINAGLNYSSTEFALLPNSRVSTSTFATFGPTGVARAGHPDEPGGVQPIGYDCTKSAECGIVFGDSLVSQRDPESVHDNVVRTMFNPYDVNSLNTGSASFLEREIKDTQSSAWIDIDWDVDFDVAGLVTITTLEAGFKGQRRNKDVDNQSHTIERANAPVTATRFNDEGEAVGLVVDPGDSLGDIPLSTFFSGESFPYNDFMTSVGAPASRLTSEGWNLVSSDKLFELALSNGDLRLNTDDTQTRGTELENKAFYFMANFSLFDDTVSGDIGVRRIKTEMNNWGYSGLNFHGNANLFQRFFDPFQFRALADDTNPRCAVDNNGLDYDTAQPALIPNPNDDPAVDGDEYLDWVRGDSIQRRHLRIDGNGWIVSEAGFDVPLGAPNAPIPIPKAADYPCHDPLLANANLSWFGLWRHSDLSTERQVHTDPTDHTVVEDLSRRNVLTKGKNTYSMNLPSLNLSWAINDSLIARGALSRTMSRPDIDDLKPGFRMNESPWADPLSRSGNTITLSTPELLPQKSDNLDLGVEWYFGDDNSISLVYFKKNLQDFLEEENIQAWAIDMRNLDVSDGIDPTQLILTESEVLERLANSTDPYQRGACMPTRAETGQINQDWFRSDDDTTMADELIKCALFRVQQQRNGKEAGIQGLEFGWNHNYTFLPGVLSGLGTQMSYTYQESESDEEAGDIDGTTVLKSLPTAWTPKHSYNATIYWEQDGHQLRLAYRGKSDELIERSENDGALWREGSNNLDFSATYKVNDMVSVDFNAINLTNALTRNFWTSNSTFLGDTQEVDDGEGGTIIQDVPFDEGNVVDGSGAYTGRTILAYKTGTRYRLGLRVKF